VVPLGAAPSSSIGARRTIPASIARAWFCSSTAIEETGNKPALNTQTQANHTSMENGQSSLLEDSSLALASRVGQVEVLAVPPSTKKNWNSAAGSVPCLIAGVVLLFISPGFAFLAASLLLAGFVLSSIAIVKRRALSIALIVTGAILSAYATVQSDFDSTSILFLNKFVGKSYLLDRSIELISDTFILNGVLFVALLWFIWFRDKREESRIRLFMGGVAAVLAGLLSRLLQLFLTFHCRPLLSADLKLTSPIGVESGTLNHWNCFPSDHAALFFGLATLIWINDRRLGVFALFWAAIVSSTRVYLGFHYPSDILGGEALGIFMVILFQRFPLPALVSRLLDWERKASSSFYAVAFITSYQAGTLFNDVRDIGHLLVQLLLRHPV
jgi:undecaprenyl-diphosphatase